MPSNIDSPADPRAAPPATSIPTATCATCPSRYPVGPLTPAEIDAALAAGLQRAADYRRRGLIVDAALMLAGETRTLSGARIPSPHC